MQKFASIAFISVIELSSVTLKELFSRNKNFLIYANQGLKVILGTEYLLQPNKRKVQSAVGTT